MSFFGSVAKVWDAIDETRDALDVAKTCLERGDSPMAALRAVASQSANQVDDAAVAELEALMRKGIVILEAATRAAVVVSEKLADPRVRQGLEKAIGVTIDFGYACGKWRHHLKQWAEE